MSKQVKKPEERRREIVSASRCLFLEKEYEKTTMQDVMEKVQIAKGTVYHYFKSKEDLLDAVVKDMVVEFILMVETALNECRGNALEKMRTLIMTGAVAPQRSDMSNNLHRPGNMRMHMLLLAMIITHLAPLYEKVISEGCKEGIFHVAHPLECAEILLAGIQFITDTGFYPWNKKDLQRRALAIPVLLETQLQTPKGAFNFLIEPNSRP